MQPLRVAAVRYLNTAPLIDGLEVLEGLEVLPSVPSAIAGMVRDGRADIGLASIVDALAPDVGATPLALLPVGMIGCDGPTLTVRLYSRVPFGRVGTLHADVESHTSVVLARLLLARRFGARAELAEFSRGAGEASWPDTLLLIGDKVVTAAPPAGTYAHELDLGEEWHAWTGLPFVYAMWMCRAAEAGSASIARGAALLDRQRRHNAMRLDALIARRAVLAGWQADVARHYVRSLLRYEVTDRARAGVERFFSEAGALGLLPTHAGPAWADAALPASR